MWCVGFNQAIRFWIFLWQACLFNTRCWDNFLSDPSPIVALTCHVSQSVTKCVSFLRLDWCNPGVWRCTQPLLVLPAVVSFDSHVVGIGTKWKPCCWWCQELIWPIFSPLKTILTCFFSPSFWTKLYPLRRVIWFQKSDLTKFSCHFGPFVEEKYFRPIFFAHDPVGTLLEYIIRGRWWMTKGCMN